MPLTKAAPDRLVDGDADHFEQALHEVEIVHQARTHRSAEAAEGCGIGLKPQRRDHLRLPPLGALGDQRVGDVIRHNDVAVVGEGVVVGIDSDRLYQLPGVHREQVPQRHIGRVEPLHVADLHHLARCVAGSGDAGGIGRVVAQRLF